MREIYYGEAIHEALIEELKRDDNVILLGEDIAQYGGAFKITKGLVDQFGENRVINTPISEASFVGMAVGAAMNGLRPVVEIMFMDFITLAMDQIVNHAAKLSYIYGGQIKVPLVIRTPAGAGRGYGASHSQSLEAWFMHVPGLKVIAPSNAYDAKGLLKSAIRDNSPVIFVENKLLYSKKGMVPVEPYTIPIGCANITRQGKDCTIIFYSRMITIVEDAAADLQAEGIDVEIIDLRTLAPLDSKTILASVAKTGRVIIVEEDCKTMGVGAEISAQVVEYGFKTLCSSIKRIACADVPIPCCSSLEQLALPDKGKIIDAVKQIMDEG